MYAYAQDQEPVKLIGKFIILASGFMRVQGGRPDRGADGFLPVRSNIHYTGGGLKWSQIIPVWVGEEKTPEFIGLWADIKERVKAAGGKYTQCLYVTPVEDMEAIYRLDISGEHLNVYINTLKALKLRDNKLTKKVHTIEYPTKEAYTITGRTFYRPRMDIKPLPEKNLSEIGHIITDKSVILDEYIRALIECQEGDVLPHTQQNAPNTGISMPPSANIAPPPSSEPPLFEGNDDLPF
jgi:hypothetical protein